MFFRILCLVALLAATPVASTAEDIERLGGDLSVVMPDARSVLQVAAPNVAELSDRRDRQIRGFSVFHRIVRRKQGLGPRFNNNSCGGCHVENGKGPAVFDGKRGGSTMLLRVAMKETGPNGEPIPVPGVGFQIQDQRFPRRRKIPVRLRWRRVKGTYPDGTRYTLRKPNVRFRVRGVPRRKINYSLRMSPMLVGMGLLEAIPEETVLALADPNDLNGDGISGVPHYVRDERTGGSLLGRFGFKAIHPTVEQQSAAAAFFDMGVTSPLFPEEDGSTELSAEELDILTVYQQLPGMPFARGQYDPQVIQGKQLFREIGCDGCHIMTLQTGEHEHVELRNQIIHPFTDLLLHDMGPGLDDGVGENGARSSEWRTTPLWGLGFASGVSRVRPLYLHDGRARTIEEAILWHGGESEPSKQHFLHLTKEQREAVLAFLNSL